MSARTRPTAAQREAQILAACGADWRPVVVVAALTQQTRDTAATYLRLLARQRRLVARLETADECELRLAMTPHHGFTRRHARRLWVYRLPEQQERAA